MFNQAVSEAAVPEFLEVALPVPLRRTFSYRVPPNLLGKAELGSRVVVLFRGRELTGYVVGLASSLPADIEVDETKIKEILELPDDSPLITEEIVKLAEWTAQYYLSFPGEVLKASLPAGLNASKERSISTTNLGREKAGASKKLYDRMLSYIAENGKTSERQLEKVFGPSTTKRMLKTLASEGLVKFESAYNASRVRPKRRKAVRFLNRLALDVDEKPLTEPQQRIIDTLKATDGELLFTDLLQKADVGGSSISTLARRGIVEVFVQEVLRDPLSDAALPDVENFNLTAEQSAALAEIESGMYADDYKAFLLHGVTGSGKTEVYMRAMRHALDRGKAALMLVPEIALTPVFSRRLRAVFGGEVAILHSRLSPGERFDEWRRIRRGEARIAIGTRSAVFAPLENLGLVIVDEEHDSSYRQHESPFYHGRDVAIMRANLAGAVVVLGSATPSLESFYNAKNGKYAYLQLPNRIGNRPLATAEVIDMREVFRKSGKDVVFSSLLVRAIEATHAKGEQSIILLNRRGFSQFVLCRTCGESIHCKNCDITLTYHRREAKLICHYCSYAINVPQICPLCKSEYLYFVGEGTEQLEDALARKFPKLHIARIDRDTVTRRRDMEKILLAFSRGDLDMLVGTQMIAKGHDFPNVTFVGVVSVDIGLGLPDFRSAERTFQLLTQVAGRAGRGDAAGNVLIQTYYPEHYAIRHAQSQDYEGFYADEIRYRERFGYPPFYALASILIRHKDNAYAANNASLLRKSLDAINTDKTCRISGPAPASLSRLKGEHRLQMLVRSKRRRQLREVIDRGLDLAEENGCDMRIVNVEIDPVNML